MTPFEKTKRKLADKRRLRKQQKKERLALELKERVEAKQKQKQKGVSRNKASEDVEDEKEDGEQAEYNMRSLVKEETLKMKLQTGFVSSSCPHLYPLTSYFPCHRKKNKYIAKELSRVALENAGASLFNVDVSDARFAPVFDGADARFGIDPTSTLFKQTEGMKSILQRQLRARDSVSDQPRDEVMTRQSLPASDEANVTALHTTNPQHLAEKLKRKFAKA
jgi:hypothetical protein